MKFPQNLLDAIQFQRIIACVYVVPKNGFENIFPIEMEPDYEYVWGAVQTVAKAHEYLYSNPEQVVKMFLYTPSVGCGNPEDWYWVIFLKQ